MICVSVFAPHMAEMLKEIRSAKKVADVIELRLDGLAGPDIARLINTCRPLPVVVTNRSTKEGGRFNGPEKERLGILAQAVSLGADFIDLEWGTAKPYRDELLSQKGSTSVIFSYHDFAGTPPEGYLRNKLRVMWKGGADVAKIVTMAKSPQDNLRILGLMSFADSLDLPLTAFCMGEQGKISRLACLSLGGFMTYASVGTGKETAPGQISAANLKEAVQLLGLSYVR